MNENFFKNDFIMEIKYLDNFNNKNYRCCRLYNVDNGNNCIYFLIQLVFEEDLYLLHNNDNKVHIPGLKKVLSYIIKYNFYNHYYQLFEVIDQSYWFNNFEEPIFFMNQIITYHYQNKYHNYIEKLISEFNYNFNINLEYQKNELCTSSKFFENKDKILNLIFKEEYLQKVKDLSDIICNGYFLLNKIVHSFYNPNRKLCQIILKQKYEKNFNFTKNK